MPASGVALLTADLSLLKAAIAGPEALSRALDGYEVAAGWEVFPTTVKSPTITRVPYGDGVRTGPFA